MDDDIPPDILKMAAENKEVLGKITALFGRFETMFGGTAPAVIRAVVNQGLLANATQKPPPDPTRPPPEQPVARPYRLQPETASEPATGESGGQSSREATRPADTYQFSHQDRLDEHVRQRYPGKSESWYETVGRQAEQGMPPRPDLDMTRAAASGQTPPPAPPAGTYGFAPEQRSRGEQEAPIPLAKLPGERGHDTYGVKADEPTAQPDQNAKTLDEIRAGVLELVRQGAQGKGLVREPGKDRSKEAPTDDKTEREPGHKEAFRPITDRLLNTRVGRIGHNAYKQVRQFFPKSKPTVGNKDGSNRSRDQSTKAKPTGRATARRPVASAKPNAVGAGRATGAAARGAGMAAGGGAGAAGGGAAAAGGGAAGAGAMAAAGPVGVVVAATVALVELAKAGHDLAYSQEEHARKLAEMSPSQAANVQQLDYQRMMRDFEKGEATAGSSGNMMESIDRFEKAIQPIETAVTNIMNTVGTQAMESLSNIAEGVNVILEGLKNAPMGVGKAIKAVLEGEENGKNGELLGDFMKRVHDEEKAKRDAAQKRIDELKRDRDGNGGWRRT